MWEVIDALGSAGSAVLAAVAGIVAYKLFKVESARDLQSHEFQVKRDSEDRRRQASMIGIWAETKSEILTLFVANHSPLPIYACHIFAAPHHDAQLTANRETHQVVGQGRYIASPSVLTAGETMSMKFLPVGAVSSDGQHRMLARIYFRDNAGAYWERDTSGNLSEVEHRYTDHEEIWNRNATVI